jgi:hypothetical protein
MPPGKRNYEVFYVNHALEFPDYRDTKALEQAEQQADRLRTLLAKPVAGSVKVIPVLALPGWYITNSTKPKFWVLTPKAARQWIAKERAVALSPQTLAIIADRLEEKCRDVEL